MKKSILLILFFFSISFYSFSQEKTEADKNGYEIKIRIKGYTSGQVFLAHYAGDKTYLADSGMLNKEGWVVFKGSKPLQCGIYMAALGRTKLFEFLVKEQKFSLVTDTVDFAKNIKVTGSPENEIFMTYQIKAGDLGYQTYLIRERYKAAEKAGDTKLVEALKDTFKIIANQEKSYYKKITTEQPNSMLAKILNAMEEIEVPAAAKNDKGQLIDTSRVYHQYLIDYWKKVDFSCECLAYTPIYMNKLKNYFERYVIPQPDTVIKWADYVINLSRSNKEIFKQTVQWLTNTYANNNYVCMDAVPVHLILKYYTYDQAFWMDSTGIQTSRARAEALLPTLCNKKAPNLEMHDSILEKQLIQIVKSDSDVYSRSNKILNAIAKYKTVSLYDVKTPYTILMFWDPDCSHCKAEMPLIEEIYKNYKSKGVEVYAACVEQEFDKWTNYINEKKLNWINVIDIYNLSEFRKNYDISSTPVIFLLDKDKKILAKKLNGKTLEQLLEFEFKEKK